MANSTDIQRLVYPPKAWVFVKTANGDILDLTNFVIAGEVKRVIGAPSTASITLRNPNHLFTTFGSKYATLHPMDPITIYMERFPGRHVQVFTGYLDTTPYLQLIPGPVTIQATCTLKRLQYNYFQLAQAYTLSFFKHFGWNIAGEGEGGGIIPSNQGPLADKEFANRQKEKWAEEVKEGKLSEGEVQGKEATLAQEEKLAAERAKKATNAQGEQVGANTPSPFANPESPGGKPQVIGDDGSFKKLLWAVLYYMADWKDENIYIEEIPPGVPELIAALWADFNEGERQEGLKALKAYWSAIIGVGAKGKGGGAGNPANQGGGKTGNLTNVNEIVETMSQTAEKFGLPPQFVIGTALCEESFNQSEITSKNSAGAIGWFQFTSSEPYPGIKVNYPNDAEDTGLATTAFCEGAVHVASGLTGGKGLPPESEWQHWAEETQKPGNGAYDESWSRGQSQAAQYIQQYKPKKAEGKEGGSSTERGKTVEGETNKTSSGSKTRIKAMEEEADAITAAQYPYSYGGGHESAGRPSLHPEHENGEGPNVVGFDCSGSVGAVLAAGGFIPENSAIPGSGSFSGLNIPGWVAGEDTSKPSVNVYFNSQHAWMGINGRYFSTSSENPRGGAGWTKEDPAKVAEYFSVPTTVMHLSTASLEQTYTGNKPPPLTANPGSPAEKLLGETGEAEGVMGQATAASFLSQIAGPTAEEYLLARAIGGQRALMNTTPVLNLIEQVCKSSLRSFMSLPNGDFYAFYPDYFGEFGHHEPYWQIKNIEVQSGTIELTDVNLITHYFAIGDVSWPGTQNFINELYAGAMTVYEAFQPGILLHNEKPAALGNEPEGGRATGNLNTAVAFLKRYGARPAKEDFTMVYSSLFDQLLAYQQFLLAWSRQFQSAFHFTFMPELFPGGKVAFPESGIQMFVEEVTHAWDITDTGFETSAVLTAPSVFRNPENTEAVNELPENMVEALIEPLRKQIGKVASTPEPPHSTPSPIIKSREEARNKAFGPGPGGGNVLVTF